MNKKLILCITLPISLVASNKPSQSEFPNASHLVAFCATSPQSLFAFTPPPKGAQSLPHDANSWGNAPITVKQYAELYQAVSTLQHEHNALLSLLTTQNQTIAALQHKVQTLELNKQQAKHDAESASSTTAAAMPTPTLGSPTAQSSTIPQKAAYIAALTAPHAHKAQLQTHKGGSSAQHPKTKKRFESRPVIRPPHASNPSQKQDK